MPKAYTSLEAELHDAFWESEDTPEPDWLDALLREHPGPALEIGCGSGRLLLPLLADGHHVEGLDPSADMLALCRQRAAARELDPLLHRGDLAGFTAAKSYTSVLIPCFTLQLLDDPRHALRRCRDLLRSGGLLYLTVFLPLAELHGELPENEWYADHQLDLPDGRRATLHTRHTLDPARQLLFREHHYRLQGPAETREHHSRQTIRWFTLAEMREQLTESGFVIADEIADFDESETINADAQILTFVARKTDQPSP